MWIRRIVRKLTGDRRVSPKSGPWFKRAIGLILLLCSITLIAVGVPILLIGGIWLLPGAILGLIGALGMSYAFLFVVEAGDE